MLQQHVLSTCACGHYQLYLVSYVFKQGIKWGGGSGKSGKGSDALNTLYACMELLENNNILKIIPKNKWEGRRVYRMSEAYRLNEGLGKITRTI